MINSLFIKILVIARYEAISNKTMYEIASPLVNGSQ